MTQDELNAIKTRGAQNALSNTFNSTAWAMRIDLEKLEIASSDSAKILAKVDCDIATLRQLIAEYQTLR